MKKIKFLLCIFSLFFFLFSGWKLSQQPDNDSDSISSTVILMCTEEIPNKVSNS